MNYYNEFDAKAAAWLRELIKQGHLPPGDVDTRSIDTLDVAAQLTTGQTTPSSPAATESRGRTQSGIYPLAHGVSGRVGLLRGYGNAIVPPLAAIFIQSAREALTHA